MVYYAVGVALLVVPESMNSWMRDHAMNPLLAEWDLVMVDKWRSSLLSDHWLFDWAPDVNAFDMFWWMRGIFLGMVPVYWALLFFLVLCSCAKLVHDRIAGGSPRHMPAGGCEKRQMLRDLLEKPKEEFGMVSRKIKPVLALNWPWRGGGLWQAVAFLLLDVGLDINTIFTFLATKQYAIAAVMSFLVVRSALKQLIALPPWRLRQDCLAALHSLTCLVLVYLVCLMQGHVWQIHVPPYKR